MGYTAGRQHGLGATKPVRAHLSLPTSVKLALTQHVGLREREQPIAGFRHCAGLWVSSHQLTKRAFYRRPRVAKHARAARC